MMKRTALKRKAPLRQTRRAGPDTEREPKPMAKASVQSLHKGTYSGGTSGKAVEKENALQHEGYMAAVRNLGYCMRCKVAGRPQFCHKDAGKGAGIKTDAREGWAGCDDCHALLGGHAGGGRLPKEERRCEELELARLTRQAVRAAGTWPKSLAFIEDR